MTDAQVEIKKFTAGADLVEGNIVELDSSGHAILCDAAEATNAIGIVYADALDTYPVSIVIRGKIQVNVLIEDTDGSSGFDKAIVPGDRLLVSGKTSGTYGVGQALSAVGGTDTITANLGEIVGMALEGNAGSTTADTYATIWAFVSFV